MSDSTPAAGVWRCPTCGTPMGSHTPTCPQRHIAGGARHFVQTGNAAPLIASSRAVARQMIGISELDGIRASYERLLTRHQPVDGVVPSLCGGCNGNRWPCDIFELAAANLEWLEVIDGTRFASDWPGPVRERRW